MLKINGYLDFVECLKQINKLSEYQGNQEKVHEYQSLLNDLLRTDHEKYQSYTKRMQMDLARNKQIDSTIKQRFD